MRIRAASSTALHAVLTGPACSARWLGIGDRAAYLDVGGPWPVLGLLTHDSIRLPCALVLPTTSVEVPLRSLARLTDGPVTVGSGSVRWDGPQGAVEIASVREWGPPRVGPVTIVPSALAALGAVVAAADVGLERGFAAALVAAGGDVRAQAAVARALLGRGPGLTPAGDDVLAGFLLGARAFGVVATGVLAALGEAPTATTALSTQLLRYAARGECVPELAAVVAVLGQPEADERARNLAAGRLLAVGHTSGAALALGLLCAGRLAPVAGVRAPAA